MTIRECKSFITERLNQMIAQLPTNQKIQVIEPRSIEEFSLTHPIGAFALLWKKDTYESNKMPFRVMQDRQRLISIFLIARNLPNLPHPDDYTDMAIQALCDDPIVRSEHTAKPLTVVECNFLGEEVGLFTNEIVIAMPDVLLSN